MPHDPALLEFLIRIFSIIAAIFATSCPVIYSFSPWWSTPLGRVVMLQAVSFALLLDLIVLFKFLEPASSSAAFFAVRTIMYGMISLATGPSRTADIEKTLVVGVHGPKEVFCFLTDD